MFKDGRTNGLQTAHACSLLADFSTLKMETMRSSETSVHTRYTWCYIPEDDILHSHCHENLKFNSGVECSKMGEQMFPMNRKVVSHL
jgi:hypothetical protein